jgi:hypothetical protein
MIAALRLLGVFGLTLAAFGLALSFGDRDPAAETAASSVSAPARAGRPPPQADLDRLRAQYDLDDDALAAPTSSLARSTAALQAVSDFRAEVELDRQRDAQDAAQADHARTWRWRAVAALIIGVLALAIAQRRARARRPQVAA